MGTEQSNYKWIFNKSTENLTCIRVSDGAEFILNEDDQLDFISMCIRFHRMRKNSKYGPIDYAKPLVTIEY